MRIYNLDELSEEQKLNINKVHYAAECASNFAMKSLSNCVHVFDFEKHKQLFKENIDPIKSLVMTFTICFIGRYILELTENGVKTPPNILCEEIFKALKESLILSNIDCESQTNH